MIYLNLSHFFFSKYPDNRKMKKNPMHIIPIEPYTALLILSATNIKEPSPGYSIMCIMAIVDALLAFMIKKRNNNNKTPEKTNH